MLDTEMRVYEEKFEGLEAEHSGQFVVIVGEEVLGVYDDPKTTYAAGLDVAGNVPMLVQQIGGPQEAALPALTLGLL